MRPTQQATIETYELRERWAKRGDPGYGDPLDRAVPRHQVVERWYELVAEGKH